MKGTCGVGGVRDHGEDVLQDVTEVRLVEALRRRLLLGHVLEEGVEDLQAWGGREGGRARTTHTPSLDDPLPIGVMTCGVMGPGSYRTLNSIALSV